MKSSNLLRAYAFALCILMSECTGFKNSVKVNHTNFNDEIQQSQNLVFTFNQNLVPDSLVDKWDTTTYIVFTPRVDGKFKWSAKNELTFSPYDPFEPCTDFKAVITNAVASKSKTKWAVDKGDVISFHTPYLKLQSSQVYWAISDHHPGQVEVRINLNFNYKVKPNDVASLLHVSVKGKESPFEMNTLGASSTISVAVPLSDLESNEETTPIKFVINKGFGCLESDWKSKDVMQLTTEIPSKQKLQVAEVTPSFVENQGIIVVRLNQPLVNENLSSLVKINSAISYTVETLDGGLVIKGAFEPGTTYNVTLNGDLKGIFGTSLGQDYSQQVVFGQIAPLIAFANDKSMYLSSAGAKNIALNISGVKKIKVSVIRIYENNILSFFHNAGYQQTGSSYERVKNYKNNEGDDEENDDNGEDEDGNHYTNVYHSFSYYNYDGYGDSIKEKTYEVKSLQRSGGSVLLHLSPEDMGYDNSFKGIYIVRVADADKQFLQASKIISYSDIGLITKENDNEILVFANSIKTAEPVAGAKIRFISSNNQTVTTLVTDNNGFAKLSNVKSFKPFDISMIMARMGEDFNFMIFSRNTVETSRYDVGGKTPNAANYDCFIYGERDIYRPGDTIHVNAVIRSFDWQTLKNVPVKFKLLSPNGKEYKSVKQTLDVQGSVAASFSLPTSIITGLYTVEIYTGNDVLLNFSKVSVEEFMPDRIKVKAVLNKTEVKPSDSLSVSISADNLFGTPAGNRKYESTLDLRRKYFSSDKYSDYRFNINEGENIPIESVVRQGETDDKGKAHQSFTIPALADIGVLEGDVLTTVFDESGRPVNKFASFTVNTQTAFYGIKYMNTWVDTRHKLPIAMIALDKDGKPIIAQAVIQVIRYHWETVYEREEGYYRYNSEEREQVISEENVLIPEEGFTYKFTPLTSGDYEIRVKRPGAKNYVAQQFWAYGWGDTQSTSFQVSNEGEVKITQDKKKYNVGENANLLFTSPFEGKILVTVERDKVYEYYYLKTDKKAASLSIPVKEEYLPNVYITATAIRELKDNSMPLTVARAFVPLMVDKPSNKIPVVITAVEKSRSKTRQNIVVKSVPNAELTIAVVDEGILQLKGFKTPEPYDYFYSKRSLQVDDYDLYPYLFPELPGKKSSTGGDEDQPKRVNPVTANRVKLVTFWSGTVKANDKGIVNFPIDIPSFSGALRIMAVAYKDRTFGSADKVMKVADPIVISTSLPRFLSPGDSINVPVTLTNTTSKEATVSALITVSPNSALELQGYSIQPATIKANSEKQVMFHMAASHGIGVSTVTVAVSGLNEMFVDKTEIGVRPSSPLQKITDAGSVAGGSSATLNLIGDFLPAGASAKLVISHSPIIQFGKNLSYLIQYPYGCVEQTVSTAFPQIYFTDIVQCIGSDRTGYRFNPNYNVQEAIYKLEAMQLGNGSLSYWLGEEDESWWGSAYGAHFLFEAKRAGFDVNQQALDRLFAYLQYKLKSFDTEKYNYFDDSHHYETRTIAHKEIIYSMYILGLAGKFDYTSMNYYKSNENLLSLDGKYMLACTYALSGSNVNYLAILPKIYDGEHSVRSFSGSFYSDIRDEALALNALIEADPNNAQVGLMAKHLSERLKQESWLNTSESAFSFLALGKLARKVVNSNATATVSVNGNEVGNFTDKNLVIKQGLYNKAVVVKATGVGNIYYFWEVEGVNAKGSYTPVDNFMRVRKQFFDRFGHEIKNNTFNQNDLVVVRLSVYSVDYRDYIQNVAITDMLPAGFEIENPRVGTAPELDWIKDNGSPDYLDMRDDRINFFTTVTDRQQYFYYLVRAVSKGKFVMGPVSADAMYNDEYHSINGSATINVK